METPTETPSADGFDDLHEELCEMVVELATGHEGWSDALAEAIIALLTERGHLMPGYPPAKQILADAQQFAMESQIKSLVIRLQRIKETKIKTPESKGMARWLDDYIDGKNHGPLGKPMFWPSGLPGLCEMMRAWGYAPTPTHPPFVGRQVAEDAPPPTTLPRLPSALTGG